jgi:hypothetical protein
MSAAATASHIPHRNQAEDGLRGYLQVLAGERPAGKLIEIRYATGQGGMRQMFVAARRVDLATTAIRRLAEHADVYAGVLLRTRRAGGRDAVTDSHLAWVDIDQDDALERIAAFDRPPTMIVSTGTRGHCHCYFQLDHEIPPETLVAANRRLAHALGGDLASVDPARILRPPSSWNRKHSPPAPVMLIELHTARRYTIEELVGELPDPPPAPRATNTGSTGGVRVARGALDEQLLAIPTIDYIQVLTGLEADRAGKVHCPFHQPDRTPSLHCYSDGTWFCFGCGAGGSIYDFASRLWSTGTRGREFLALRARLATELLPRQFPKLSIASSRSFQCAP